MIARKIAMAAGICAMVLGGVAVSEPAFAQTMQYDLRRGDVIVGPGYDDRYDRRYERRDDRRYRPGCSPRSALSEARRWLDEPRIKGQNRQYYYIDGYGKRGGNRGRPDTVYIDAMTCDRR